MHDLNVYAPAVEKVATLASLITDFTGRVLGIRPAAAIPMFAESDLLDKKELKELKSLLEDDGNAVRWRGKR